MKNMWKWVLGGGVVAVLVVAVVMANPQFQKGAFTKTPTKSPLPNLVVTSLERRPLAEWTPPYLEYDGPMYLYKFKIKNTGRADAWYFNVSPFGREFGYGPCDYSVINYPDLGAGLLPYRLEDLSTGSPVAIDHLRAGEEATLYAPIACRSGETPAAVITVIVDPFGLVLESNESDNSRTFEDPEFIRYRSPLDGVLPLP